MKRHLVLAVMCMASTRLLAQKGAASVAPRPVNSDVFYDSAAVSFASLVVYGNVTLTDGTPPGQLVTVERACGGLTQTGGFADSKGRFSFDLGVLNRAASQGNSIDSVSSAQLAANAITPAQLASCVVRASLPGYRSQTISLAPAANGQKTALGTITLQPVDNNDAQALNPGDSNVPKNARKDFEKGLDSAAKAKWAEAIDALQKATTGYPKYVSAWLSLGQLQAGSGNAAGALESYKKATAINEKFALPYVEASLLESQTGNWEQTSGDAEKAILLAPNSFPRAYLLDANASLNMRKLEQAEKSSLAGLKLDTDHEFPDLEYILGIALMGRKDNTGARAHLESYLSMAPAGINAVTARRTLATLPAK